MAEEKTGSIFTKSFVKLSTAANNFVAWDIKLRALLDLKSAGSCLQDPTQDDAVADLRAFARSLMILNLDDDLVLYADSTTSSHDLYAALASIFKPDSSGAIFDRKAAIPFLRYEKYGSAVKYIAALNHEKRGEFEALR